MKKSATGSAGAIDGLLVEKDVVIGIVVIFVADHIHKASPAVTNADDLIALVNGSQSDAADGWIQAGDVTSAGKDSNHALLNVGICHDAQVRLRVDYEPTIIHAGANFRKGLSGLQDSTRAGRELE